MAKNNKKKDKVKKESCECGCACGYNHGLLGVILAIVVIILVWWQPIALWSQILITLIAALVLVHKVMEHKNH